MKDLFYKLNSGDIFKHDRKYYMKIEDRCSNAVDLKTGITKMFYNQNIPVNVIPKEKLLLMLKEANKDGRSKI